MTSREADPVVEVLPAESPKAQASPLAFLREPGVLQRVVSSTFAWSVTIAPVAFSRAGSTLARVAAVLALVAAVAGPSLVPSRKRIGRHVGISLFLALTSLVWLMTPDPIEPARLDVIRATTGAIAWGVFAFAWGEPWRLGNEPQDEGAGLLRARATLPPFAVPLAGLGVATALALLGLGWWVRDPSRALAAHAISTGLGVAVVGAASTVAITRGKAARSAPSKALSAHAIRALVVLVVVALLGAIFLVIRR